MSPDEDQSKTPAPDSPTVEPKVVTRETGGQSTRRVTGFLTAIAAAAILVVLIALIVVNRSAVRVDWVFGGSSIFLAWVVLGAALLGLLLGLLLAVLLHATKSWWLVVALVIVLVAAAAAWSILLRQQEAVTPVASPSASPSLSPSPLPSFSPSPSPSPVVWTGSWARLDGVGGGLLIAGGTGAYEVTLYDGVLRPGESVPATVSADGRQLRFAPPSQFSFGGGPSGPFGATLELDGPNRATLIISDADGTAVLLPLRRVPELLPTNPSPSPSARPSAPPVESPAAP